MQSYVFRTLNDSTRPTIQIGNHLTAVIDTGADIPVCSEASVLTSQYHAVEIRIPGELLKPRGISGTITGKTFLIKDFVVGPLVYPQMKFFVPNRPTMDDTFLLSASMFSGLICEMDFKNHYFKITLPDDEQLVRLVSFDKHGEHFCWNNSMINRQFDSL